MSSPLPPTSPPSRRSPLQGDQPLASTCWPPQSGSLGLQASDASAQLHNPDPYNPAAEDFGPEMSELREDVWPEDQTCLECFARLAVPISGKRTRIVGLPLHHPERAGVDMGRVGPSVPAGHTGPERPQRGVHWPRQRCQHYLSEHGLSSAPEPDASGVVPPCLSLQVWVARCPLPQQGPRWLQLQCRPLPLLPLPICSFMPGPHPSMNYPHRLAAPGAAAQPSVLTTSLLRPPRRRPASQSANGLSLGSTPWTAHLPDGVRKRGIICTVGRFLCVRGGRSCP